MLYYIAMKYINFIISTIVLATITAMVAPNTVFADNHEYDEDGTNADWICFEDESCYDHDSDNDNYGFSNNDSNDNDSNDNDNNSIEIVNNFESSDSNDIVIYRTIPTIQYETYGSYVNTNMFNDIDADLLLSGEVGIFG
jgi:hypothetical protein